MKNIVCDHWALQEYRQYLCLVSDDETDADEEVNLQSFRATDGSSSSSDSSDEDSESDDDTSSSDDDKAVM